jgi:hypothetical protein
VNASFLEAVIVFTADLRDSVGQFQKRPLRVIFVGLAISAKGPISGKSLKRRFGVEAIANAALPNFGIEMLELNHDRTPQRRAFANP